MMNYEDFHDAPELSIDKFLDNPEELRRVLKARGALKFTPYESGLFPASDLSPEMRKATGMNKAWFRDNAHVAWALYEAGETRLAAEAGRAMLTVLSSNRDILDEVSTHNDSMSRLPVRVEGDTLVNDSEPRVQNDSVGYALWLTSRLINEGALEPSEQDLATLARVVQYLDKIEYWQDEDEGHWEEDRRIHASSIGVVIAGLHEAQEMFNRTGYEHDMDIDGLLDKGSVALNNILSEGVTDLTMPVDVESRPAGEKPYPDMLTPDNVVPGFFEKFSIRRREHDAALLFLIEPLHVLEGEQAEEIVVGVERELQRDIGFARYAGDTYWEPRFPDIMSIEERTTMVEGRTDERNQTAAGIAYGGKEAQWTLFDPVLSTYWGRRYEESGDPSHREKQLFYLQRSLDQLFLTNDGDLQLPEAYYYAYNEETGKSEWIPNDHMPLLWSQANLLRALKVFESTTNH